MKRQREIGRDVIDEVEEEQTMLLVNQAAVSTSRGTSVVYKVADDGTIQKVNVTVKYLGENLYQILDGNIAEGDVLAYNLSGSLENFINRTISDIRSSMN